GPRLVTLFPYTTLFRSDRAEQRRRGVIVLDVIAGVGQAVERGPLRVVDGPGAAGAERAADDAGAAQVHRGTAERSQGTPGELARDRKSTRLNSSHSQIS